MTLRFGRVPFLDPPRLDLVCRWRRISPVTAGLDCPRTGTWGTASRSGRLLVRDVEASAENVLDIARVSVVDVGVVELLWLGVDRSNTEPTGDVCIVGRGRLWRGGGSLSSVVASWMRMA
jgi:hypothetical protein